MSNMTRRSFIKCAATGLAIPFAPAIIKASTLMPVKSLPVSTETGVILIGDAAHFVDRMNRYYLAMTRLNVTAAKLSRDSRQEV